MELSSSEKVPTVNHEMQEVQQVGSDDKAFIDHVQQQNKHLKAVLRDHEATTSKCIALLEGLLQNGDRWEAKLGETQSVIKYLYTSSFSYVRQPGHCRICILFSMGHHDLQPQMRNLGPVAQ